MQVTRWPEEAGHKGNDGNKWHLERCMCKVGKQFKRHLDLKISNLVHLSFQVESLYTLQSQVAKQLGSLHRLAFLPLSLWVKKDETSIDKVFLQFMPGYFSL